jgi:hypothetical protein
VRDENDILFNQYSLDFFGFIDFLFRTIFSGGGITSSSGGEGLVGNFSPSSVVVWISDIWSVLVVLSWAVSALLVFGIIYAYIRHEQLGEVIGEILKRQEDAFRQIHSGQVKNARWQDVLNHADSEQPNDWKLAIIEADIILEELLSELGYAGTSVGDKLKSAPASFRTIDQAWRAHNVRNRIAHDGANFELSEVMARETIAQYKMVFDEFDFV